MKTGIELIAEERQEQLTKHNRSVEYDVEHNNDEQLRSGAFDLLWKYEHEKKHDNFTT